LEETSIMGRSFGLAAVALLISASVAQAQVGPPCCSVEVATTTLSGTVNAGATQFTTDMTGTDQTIALYTTEQQAGEVPRKVDLRPYRGRNVAVVCQLWHGSGDAWGCGAIGILKPTTEVRNRAR
jgi:hypothetical protein